MMKQQHVMITLRNYWWIKTAVSQSYCKLV